MTCESVCEQIKESLNGRPGQPIVLGVCQSLAERFEKEPWVFRLVAIVLAVLWTLPAVAAYVILGFVFLLRTSMSMPLAVPVFILVAEFISCGLLTALQRILQLIG